MIYVNYTTENKAKSKQHDNYTNNGDKNTAKVRCEKCFFVGQFNGQNTYLTDKVLCGKHITEVANVEEQGTCDESRIANKWYDRFDFINNIKKRILEKSGFKFNNR